MGGEKFPSLAIMVASAIGVVCNTGCETLKYDLSALQSLMTDWFTSVQSYLALPID